MGEVDALEAVKEARDRLCLGELDKALKVLCLVAPPVGESGKLEKLRRNMSESSAFGMGAFLAWAAYRCLGRYPEFTEKWSKDEFLKGWQEALEAMRILDEEKEEERRFRLERKAKRTLKGKRMVFSELLSRVKEMRLSGMTISEIAEELGVPKNHVNLYLGSIRSFERRGFVVVPAEGASAPAEKTV